MSAQIDKENLPGGMLAFQIGSKDFALSPIKSPKKTRSKSIGPGGLEVPLKEDLGNRRKSAFIPAVKSILTSKEDEMKRREARRKSLANRRVSFAPEATLHTWDVIEYMRDATTSSSSSNSTRRASNVSQASSARSPQSGVQSSASNPDASDPPSTPPEQVEEPLPGLSPDNQRDLHQKKRRRRSSGIPPMNFNNPEDVFSSSPFSGSSSGAGSDGIEGSSDDEDGDTAMSIDLDDVTQRSSTSTGSSESTGTSARLDEALRQASVQAGTQRINFAENGFRSEQLMSRLDAGSEIDNPFSPAFKAHATAQPPQNPELDPEDATEEMSMDITRAVGGIVPTKRALIVEDAGETMDLTMAVGGIKSVASQAQAVIRSNLKRRRSSITVPTGDAQGSPAKRQASRRASVRRRRSSAEESSMDDETMDLTVALGNIQQTRPVIGNDRRDSIDTSFGEDSMDFTMVVGGIKSMASAEGVLEPVDETQECNEDLSMELTTAIGNIGKPQEPIAGSKAPSKSSSSPVKEPDVTLRKKPVQNLPDPTPNVLESPPKPSRDAKRSPPKARRRSVRRSIAPVTPEKPLPTGKENVNQVPSPLAQNNTELVQPELSVTPVKESTGGAETSTKNIPVVPSPVVVKPNGSPVRLGLSSTPQKQSPIKKSTALSDSIKLLSTPRKQTQVSPAKKPAAATPKSIGTLKKGPTPKKTPTPKRSGTPRKQSSVVSAAVHFAKAIASPALFDEPANEADAEEKAEGERIQLQDFLDLTNIRFMDLTTTKRRHTGAPSAFLERKTADELAEDSEENAAPEFESNVVAGACTFPLLTMYQHSCHELKSYISGGRDEVRTIEADAYEVQPPLFREYLSAPPDERAIMDNQFKNMKTSARLQSKSSWYGWRSQLLKDLKNGLDQTSIGLDEDALFLEKQEELLATVLPALLSRYAELETESDQLQKRADEMASVDREELDTAREQLTIADADIEIKRRMIEGLQKELVEKETHIEAVKERKEECAEEIKIAERVREECRGWSATEVKALKARVDSIENKTGWTVASACSDPSILVLTYRKGLQLFFHPSAFTTSGASNAPISLTYIADDSALAQPKKLTTTLRFFLQLLRAHLQCVPQSRTPIPQLLRLISSGWDTALALAEGVRQLDLSFMTDEAILSDERMSVSAILLLRDLQTKVRVAYEVGAIVGETGLDTSVSVKAEVVYGERYDEKKMGEFLKGFVGNEVKDIASMGAWAGGINDLKSKLIKRGRKG